MNSVYRVDQVLISEMTWQWCGMPVLKRRITCPQTALIGACAIQLSAHRINVWW